MRRRLGETQATARGASGAVEVGDEDGFPGRRTEDEGRMDARHDGRIAGRLGLPDEAARGEDREVLAVRETADGRGAKRHDRPEGRLEALSLAPQGAAA